MPTARHRKSAPRRRSALVAIFLCAGLAWSPLAAADGSHEVNVSATVLSKNQCKFGNPNNPSELVFGQIDPSSNGDYTASAEVRFVCRGSDPQASWGIASDDGENPAGSGAPRMAHNTVGGEYLPYSLEFPASGQAPRNQEQSLTLTGRISPAQFQNVRAGVYSDAVVLTLSP